MNDQAEALRQMVGINEVNKFAQQEDMRIITVASGKGGVGKSNFSVNLGLAMQVLGQKPIVLDADFGLANVEIILGERPKFNLSHLIKGQCHIYDLVTTSKYGLPFISGGSGIKDMNFLPTYQIDKIRSQLAELSSLTNMLIIDTGAGINDIVVKFCKLAHEVYIIVTPEPTSITDGYALIKTLIGQFDLDTTIKVIVNKAMSQEEAHEVFHKLYYVTEHFLKRPIQYGGFVPYDEQLFKSVKEQVPVFEYNRQAKSSMAYYQIGRIILGDKSKQTIKKENWVSRFKKIFSH